MKIYLSGPIAGIKDGNFPLFDHVAKRLQQQGHEVFNPADLTRNSYGSLDNFLRRDFAEQRYVLKHWLAKELVWICLHAEIVYLLPDWQKSKGARAEYRTAAACHIPCQPVPNELLPDLQVVD
jgi:hypothetical protein